MKQVFFRLIWTFWLLLLGSLLTIAEPNEKSSPSVTSVHCAPVIAALTFSYDEQNIPSVAYDVPLLHARGERGIWSAGGCALLVDLANGLAAKTGAGVVDDIAIQFGKNANQTQHAFRHTDALGLNRSVVQSGVQTHLKTVALQITPGKPFNQVIEVGWQRIQYTAFKLPDGTVNVGRIHGAP